MYWERKGDEKTGSPKIDYDDTIYIQYVWLSENIPSARTKFGPVSSRIPDFEVSGLVTTVPSEVKGSGNESQKKMAHNAILADLTSSKAGKRIPRPYPCDRVPFYVSIGFLYMLIHYLLNKNCLTSFGQNIATKQNARAIFKPMESVTSVSALPTPPLWLLFRPHSCSQIWFVKCSVALSDVVNRFPVLCTRHCLSEWLVFSV